MALDTRDKRASAIGVGSPLPRVLPNPDVAAETAADRGQLAFAYSGIVAEPATYSPGLISRAGLNVTDLLAAATSLSRWRNDGVQYLVVKNAGESAVTVTLSYQAQYNLDDPTDKTVSVGAGKTVIIGPYPQTLYNDDSQYATATLSSTTGVSLAVVQQG